MVNGWSLLVGMIFGFLAQIGTFFQLQGPIKYEWLKNNYWFIVLMGIPISILLIHSVKNMIFAFDGQLWPSRLISFSVGVGVFTWLSWAVFREPLTTKTIVCLFLAISILLIQIFWK